MLHPVLDVGRVTVDDEKTDAFPFAVASGCPGGYDEPIGPRRRNHNWADARHGHEALGTIILLGQRLDLVRHGTMRESR